MQTTRALVAWIKSSQPAAGFEEVLVPGEPEYRTTQRRQREGIPIDDHLWEAIIRVAASVGVSAAEFQA